MTRDDRKVGRMGVETGRQRSNKKQRRKSFSTTARCAGQVVCMDYVQVELRRTTCMRAVHVDVLLIEM